MAAEELEVGDDDLGHPALFTLLVPVATALQPPLDTGRDSRFDVLGRRFGEAVRADDGVELRLLLAVDRAVGHQADT